MSGTSLDAVDAAMIFTDGERVLEFGPACEREYTIDERLILQNATRAARAWNWEGPPPQQAFTAAKGVISSTHLSAWEKLLFDWDGPRPVLAGVHGQTVLHRRAINREVGATLQLIDASALQAGLGVPLAFDFRSADVVAGGQGAPLAPAYHLALMDIRASDTPMAVLNLGGVGNITYRDKTGMALAFDTGPANGPIDEWIEQHGAGRLDQGGAIARSGEIDHERVAILLERRYFKEAPPKSLDRFDFNADMASGMSLADGAATLTAFSAACVGAAFEHLTDEPSELIVCGGGRHNPVFMELIKEQVPCAVLSAEEAGWRGDSLEAEAFAFLAARRLRGLPISWPTTTGAPEPMTGGDLIGD